MLHPTLHQLRDAFRTYVQTHAPDISSFCGASLAADHPQTSRTPANPLATERLDDLASSTCAATAPLFHAIRAAAPHVAWQQSYSIDDPGFDQNYLDTCRWFNLIAPSGPFVSADLRLSVGYWGQGLQYPRHWHEPEEIYLTIAGSALYISEGRASVQGGPGTTICHASNQPHAAKFDQAPLLAAAFWRGNNLEVKSGLDA